MCAREKKTNISVYSKNKIEDDITCTHILTDLVIVEWMMGDSFISNDVRLLIDYKNKALLSLYMPQCQC